MQWQRLPYWEVIKAKDLLPWICCTGKVLRFCYLEQQNRNQALDNFNQFEQMG